MIASIAWTYIIFAFRTIVPMVSLPFLSHLVGVDGTGVILSCQALGLVGGLIIQFGFHQTATRELGVSEGPAQRSAIVGRILAAQFATSFCAVVIVGLAAWATPVISMLPAGVLGAVLIAVGSGLSPAWYFRGTDRAATGVMIELIGQIVALMLILMFVRRPADVSLALLFSGVGPFALSVCGIGLTVFETRPQQIPAVGEVIERLAASFPLFLVRLSSTGFTMSAAWIASLLTGPRETAYFGIAAKIASALTTFSQPVLFALLPNISRAATISRYSALRMSLRWGGALVALGVFSVASVYLFADLFIKLLFAKDMAPAAEITRALAWICIIAAFRDTLGDLVLVPLRRDKAVAVCVVVGSAVGLISAFTLAPTFGAYGMVAARLLGEVMVVALMAISLFLYLRKKR